MKLLLIAILLQIAHLSAQTDSVLVKGKVIDSETMEPLLGANVYNLITQKKTSTDFRNGGFEFSAAKGTLILQTDYIGYVTRIDTIVLNDVMNNLVIELESQTFIVSVGDSTLIYPKRYATKDIKNNILQLFLEFKEKELVIVNSIAAKYGLLILPNYDNDWIDEYNLTMIEYLKTQKSENWYSEFLEEVKNELEKHK